MARPAPAADFAALLVGLLALIEAHRARVTSAAAVALWAAVSNVVALARVYAAAPDLWTLRPQRTDAPEFSGGACALSLDRPADWHEHPGAAPPAVPRRLSPGVVVLRHAMAWADLRRARQRHPAADLPPVPGRVLWRATRDNGDELTLTGYCLPRPFVRLEVRRGDEVRSVALTLCELPDLTFALLRAPRALAAAARRLA